MRIYILHSSLLAIGGVLLACSMNGCGSSGGVGPDVTVDPSFRAPVGEPAPDGHQLAVSVKVVDARNPRGPIRPDGREVIAEGDKGKVFLREPVERVVARDLEDALRASGFKVQPDAPVVLEATVVDLPVEATQFTNWGLPSERASTLDALGAIVPGPVRPTTAKASLNIVVRKNDTRLGFSHVVTHDASNKSADRSVVEQTLAQAINGAVTQAVAEAAPDIEIVTRTPVTAKEINGRGDELNRQEEVVQALSQSLSRKEAALAEDRGAVEAMRRQLEQDRQALESQTAGGREELDRQRAALAAERKEIATQQQAASASQAKLQAEGAKLETDRKALQARLDQLAAKSDDARQTEEARAQIQQQQKDLEAKSAALEKQNTELAGQSKALQDRAAAADDREKALAAEAARLANQAAQVASAQSELEARRKNLEDRQKNLSTYEKKLSDQTAANQSLLIELNQREKDLQDREAALAKWKQDLEARANVKPPPAVVEQQRPLIVITQPGLAKATTTLPRLSISGVAAGEADLAALHATINGERVDLLAPPPEGTRAITFRPARDTPYVTQGKPGSPMAAKPFSFDANLHEGPNDITIEAVDRNNLSSVEHLSIRYDKPEGKTVVVSIGINQYSDTPLVPPLKFAVSDAMDLAKVFHSLDPGRPNQVRMLLDDKANHQAVVDELFDRLPTEAGPADTVIIFFSGHGAPDIVSGNASGNVEAFLLPSDADPTRLFSTAIRMSDVETILRRLQSERIVFLADTCFSGAAAEPGSRGISVPGRTLRAITFRSAPHLPSGKGCAILTASKDTEAAQERSELGHGLFSYYVLQGLRGAADANHDHVVTVDELYNYVQTMVSRATGGAQTPQINRDPAAGDIVLSEVPEK